MSDETFPVRWAGQQAVVTLPQHISNSNADQIRELVLWIINRGAAVLIADLSGTLSCDFSGADALARAHHRAVANGTELRLVARTAHALHSAAADTAALLERRADLLGQPGRIDYPTEIKRLRALADQARQMAEHWERP
jgi:anti-anti-sigma regulatory factor